MQKIGFCDKFSLTQAVLNGTKTMTRRVEKGLETFKFDYEVQFAHSLEIFNQYWDEDKNCLAIITPQCKIKAPTRYKLGEVVAVAQSYKDAGFYPKAKCGYYYDENEESVILTYEKSAGWNNKLFVKAEKMPHQIKMTSVRIERLQDISDEDCLKEGIQVVDTFYGLQYCAGGNPITDKDRCKLMLPTTIPGKCFFDTPREAFSALIDRPGVGRKGLWESNPWVVVYEFKLIK